MPELGWGEGRGEVAEYLSVKEAGASTSCAPVSCRSSSTLLTGCTWASTLSSQPCSGQETLQVMTRAKMACGASMCLNHAWHCWALTVFAGWQLWAEKVTYEHGDCCV